MFIVYNLLLTLLSPLWVPWMLFRVWRRKEQPNWAERSGNYETLPKKGDRPRLWMHAVSVGEVVAARPLLKAIRAALPSYEIILSVTTSSGHQTARESEAGLYDHLVYFPIDIARFQLRAMQRVRPDVICIMETELWMNFLWAAKTFAAKVFLLNGRISDRSYPRSLRLKAYYEALLKDVDGCFMQSAVDAERIESLGAKHVEVLGNVKFDQSVEGIDEDAFAWGHELGLDLSRPVVVIGSTRGEMEEKFVLSALKIVGLDKLTVIHAPRHLERVPALVESLRRSNTQPALRSAHESGSYLILDTYGELSKTYGIADIVIIGGGFSNQGGQNLLQPLGHGKPVLHGTHMQNFRDVVAMSVAAGASEACASPEELAAAIQRLLDDPARRQRMGTAARTLVMENLGAVDRYVQRIKEETEPAL